MELQAFDPNLRLISTVQFRSLIWIDRYNRVGSCEVYAPATDRNRAALKIGNYVCVMRGNYTEMMCLIVNVKEKENPETGAFITAIGFDSKYWLDRRVNVSMLIFNSSGFPGADLESFISRMLTTGGERRVLKPNLNPLIFFNTGGASAVEGNVSQEVLGLSYGAMTRQICGSLDAGYRFIVLTEPEPGTPAQDRLPGFGFEIYEGEDRSEEIEFSRNLNNVGNINYSHDVRNYKNVCYIQNPDVRFQAAVLGSALWNDRIESFLKTSVTPSMQYSDIRDSLEATWNPVQNGDNVDLSCTDLFVPVLSPWQLNRLQSWQPGGDTTTRDGFFHVPGPVVIASSENVQLADVDDSTNFDLIDTMYDFVQLCAGVEYLNGCQESETLDVEMIDNSYVYRRDYHLGDLVTVRAHGTASVVRIVEVMECWDENGYHLEPRTEYTANAESS